MRSTKYIRLGSLSWPSKLLALSVFMIVYCTYGVARSEEASFTSDAQTWYSNTKFRVCNLNFKNQPDSSKTVSTRVIIQKRQNDRWFAYDKLLHLSISANLVGGGFRGSHYILKESEVRSRWVACLSTLSFGILKEVWDSHKPDNFFSLKDLTADIAGITIGIVVFTL